MHKAGWRWLSLLLGPTRSLIAPPRTSGLALKRGRVIVGQGARAGAEWLDVSGDGGVLKRVVSSPPPFLDGRPARPRRRSLCNVDFELRVVDDATGLAGPLLGEARAYKFLLRGQGEVDGLDFEGPAAQGSSVKGLHVGLPSMVTGEVADLRLAPAYAFGAPGAPPEVPGQATVELRVKLNSCVRYSTGESVSESEREQWEAQIRSDPMLVQSTILKIEQEEASCSPPYPAESKAPAVTPKPLSRVDLGKLKGKELKEMCRDLSLPVSGKKAELIQRITAAEAATVPEAHETVQPQIDPANSPQSSGAKTPVAAALLAEEVEVVASPKSPAVETERKMLPKDVQWASIPSPGGQPQVGVRKAPGAQSARMFEDEKEKVRETPNIRLKGVESTPVSQSHGGWASAVATMAKAAGNDPSGELASALEATVSWEEDSGLIDVVVSFNADVDASGADSPGLQGLPLRAKDLDVVIAKRRVRVAVKAGARGLSAGLLVAEGELAGPVDSDASLWWIDEPPADLAEMLASDDDKSASAPQPRIPPHAVRLSLRKQDQGIWAGVWKAELERATEESAKRR